MTEPSTAPKLVTSKPSKATVPAPMKLTGRRAVKFTVFWVCVVLAFPAVLIVGVVWGATKGVGQGLSDALNEATRDLRWLWDRCEK